MRLSRWMAMGMMAACAKAAVALPPIVFYSYTPPQPTLGLVSLKPANRQEFSVAAPPQSVVASFTEVVDPDRSELKVFDAYNNLISAEKTMPKDTSMVVALPKKLLSETYRVEWKATCGCAGNAVISGTSYFTVY